MEVTLTRFVHALRSADVPASPAETLDGFAVVRQVGIGDPALLENALALTLAKSREEKARFADCFQRFFHQLAFQQPAKRTMLRDVDQQGLIEFIEAHASDELVRVVASVVQDEKSYLAFVVQEAAERLRLSDMQSLRDKAANIIELSTAVGVNELDSLIHGGTESGGGFMPTIRYVRQYLHQQVRQYVDAQYKLHVDASGRKALIAAALKSNLDRLPPDYYAEVDRVVRKLADRLAQQHRRRRKRAHRGVLDIKRMIRDNVAYDGAMFNLSWRQRRVERSAVYVVCDVSNSVSRVARFLLLFLYQLVDVLPKVRAFAFSNRLGEITDVFSQHGHERAVEEAMFLWGTGTTDYGHALVDFRSLVHQQLDHRSTVIFLGDARGNYFDPRVDILRDISNRVKQVFWLNPENRDHWGEGDSVMRAYAPFCLRVDSCNQLHDIERFADRLLNVAR
ncbi:MAG: VWA domain-containing protein [Pseudomonadales bacterium]